MKKELVSTRTEATYEKAVELAHKFIITDGHIDLPWRISTKNLRQHHAYREYVVQNNQGDFDYARAKKGGLSAPFIAIYIASTFQNDLASAKAEAISLMDIVTDIIQTHPDKFAGGDSPGMIEENFRKGLISFPMALENGAPLIELEDVRFFYEKGIRYITLTHAKDNHICDSSYDNALTWNGLSPYGKLVINEMNRVGMMIDVSHISDKAFFQVMDRSAAPVIASHSSCRKFTPNWERNMDDDMINLLGKKEGIIQINFGSDFLDARVAKIRTENRKELEKRLKKLHLSMEDESAKPVIEEFTKAHPGSYSDVSRVADHIDHARNIAGIDCVGFGSDFDGVGDSLPEGLKDVSQYPNLILELMKRGYTEEDIEKLCYKNVWRVWHKVKEAAESK